MNHKSQERKLGAGGGADFRLNWTPVHDHLWNRSARRLPFTGHHLMIVTPAMAGFLRLKTPRSAMVFGGLAGTVSGVSAGLAATDRRLVPYGALVATFHTG